MNVDENRKTIGRTIQKAQVYRTISRNSFTICSCRIAVYLLLLKTIKPILSLMLIINTLHISKAKHKSLFPFRCGNGNKWQRQLNLPQLNKIYKTTVYSSTFDPIQRRKQYILNKCLFREAMHMRTTYNLRNNNLNLSLPKETYPSIYAFKNNLSQYKPSNSRL
jgi:hypothetical protein